MTHVIVWLQNRLIWYSRGTRSERDKICGQCSTCTETVEYKLGISRSHNECKLCQSKSLGNCSTMPNNMQRSLRTNCIPLEADSEQLEYLKEQDEKI